MVQRIRDFAEATRKNLGIKVTCDCGKKAVFPVRNFGGFIAPGADIAALTWCCTWCRCEAAVPKASSRCIRNDDERAPSELERSYELVGRILARLVSKGLTRLSLGPGDFGDQDDRDHYAAFMDVMSWLQAEGLIRIGPMQMDGTHHQVQLTAVGLRAIEDSRFGEGKTIRAVIEGKKGELSAGAFTKIGAFVGGLMGGAAKTLGG